MGIGLKDNFDATELCDDGGEIGEAIKHLWSLCMKHQIPLVGYVATRSTDDLNNFRGFQVSRNGDMPSDFVAVQMVMESEELAEEVITKGILQQIQSDMGMSSEESQNEK